ncbi:ribonuclease R [Niabella drilacis]|uniref:Ribonuclease R n=1 Tax=Niabella drilacis (strain DSM 25811 / CCM 8410 / CCUG 62505 / LMG 26954 / E90) TaxID=1285928 RepID=A0A1G6YDL8_NIADE|nr:ribonuclease R [Niabella drilacis]SDD88093.1 ribonuclease R [Niabella drilacis]
MAKKIKKKKNKSSSGSEQLLKGTLEVTKSGRGFVIVPGLEEDVLIRPEDLRNAMDGDVVRVKLTSGYDVKLKGKIMEVVQRNRTEFIGTLQLNRGFGFVLGDKEKGLPDIYIPEEHLNGALNGQKVVAKMLRWEKEDKRPVGAIISILDEAHAGDIAMKETLLEKGFPLSFSDEAMEVANRIPDAITKEDLAKRKDIRNILTFTIDPEDAKDFDDAVSFRILKNGNYEVGVHIADVSHYVTPGTALDEEAYQRATSVYLPDRVNPMLPEHISNVLCSLRPDEDKLTFSAIFQLNEKAEVKQYWLGKTVIRSKRRFTYEEAQAIIETGQGDHAEVIGIVNKLSQRLRQSRFDEGAINFNSTEVRFKLDEKGVPTGIMLKVSKEAHQLIEELMLLANKYVAETASKVKINNKTLPFPYRIHDTPDEEKLLPFVAFAHKFGYKFDISSAETIAASFDKLLKDIKGRPEEAVLQQLGIRTMAKAKYTSSNIGHYGLGFENYCHFTSPIRRYPDIMVHRILLEILEDKARIDKKLEEKCGHCSERERAAMEAERSANKYKQVEYMQQFVGEEFDAIISGVSKFGFWAETVDHLCEGMVNMTSLAGYDSFKHSEADYAIIGMRTGTKFTMGDKVRIQVVAANLEKRYLDYHWVQPAQQKAPKKTASRKKKA